MKYSLPFLVIWLLTACSHQNHLPPVSGDPQPINSPAIIQELTKNV